jgi:hypothetical protein
MIIEYTYSPFDLRKRCYGCKWLDLMDNWNGKCKCEFNRVKIRERSITDKSCSCKNADRFS